MLRIIASPLRRLFRWLKNTAKSNKMVRALLYDIENASGFTSLYEHEKMLSDRVRVDTYHAAIERHVKPGDVVVDLGTGTGILSMLAAKRSPAAVYAIDHSDFISVAEEIAAANHVANIRFVKINSRSFSLDKRVDVILHEQIGDHLFDENMVENLLDMKRRLLKKTGRILPGKFQLFLEPVCLKRDGRVAYLWENRIHGIDYTFLKDSGAIARYMSAGHHLRFIPPSALDYFLCEPSPILAFDLNEMNDKDEIPLTLDVSKTVSRAGSLGGMCLYFRVIFDDDTGFDTSPLSTPTHWGNRLFRLERGTFDAGQKISYRLTMRDLIDPETWSVSMQP